MFRKKLMIITVLLVVVSLCVMATNPPGNGYTNLKVLPKNISTKDLNRIMIDNFEDDLGVSCTYCHAESKDGSHKPDYASDEKPEKEIARKMMRMTLDLNKEYFKVKHPVIGAPTLSVTCQTCHNGTPHPNNAVGE
jgi:Photosynthetic reaction centre cytochrome C subunit